MKRRPAPKGVKELSEGEETLALHLRAKGVNCEREFTPPDCPKQWRWDFAFPAFRILVEVQGGTWNRGQHARGSGIERDVHKNNWAVMNGWRPLIYTTAMVISGEAINEILVAIGSTEA